MFGAIYISDKAHLVQNHGLGPIVPLLENGDIGTLFTVDSHQEDMIPTRDGNERRRIRLESTGTGRFHIESIQQDGFSLPGTPYIVANVSVYLDNVLENEDKAKARKLLREAQRNWQTGSPSNMQIHPKPVLDFAPELERCSFALASLMTGKSSTKQRSSLLQCRNTVERIDTLCNMEKMNH